MNVSNISIFDSKYRVGFEIQTPDNKWKVWVWLLLNVSAILSSVFYYFFYSLFIDLLAYWFIYKGSLESIQIMNSER